MSASTRIDPYDARLYYATTAAEWARIRKQFGQGIDMPTSIGLTGRTWDSKTGRTRMIVWVDVAKHSRADELINTIAHEGYHAAAGLLEGLGQSLDEGEAVAYLVDWITGWLVRHTPGLEVTFTPTKENR